MPHRVYFLIAWLVLAAPAAAQPGSISGVWFSVEYASVRHGPPDELPRDKMTESGSEPQLLPWAKDVVEHRLQAYEEGRPFAKLASICIPDGMPAKMFPAPLRPIQIIETDGQVTILFETLNIFRIIYLDATLPENPTPSLMGHSVGRWEGDTLVVETIGINDKTTLDQLIPHTTELRVTERFRRDGENHLDYRATMVDPKTLAQPYTIVFPYREVPGQIVEEAVCENQRNAPDEKGYTDTQLTFR